MRWRYQNRIPVLDIRHQYVLLRLVKTVYFIYKEDRALTIYLFTLFCLVYYPPYIPDII